MRSLSLLAVLCLLTPVGGVVADLGAQRTAFPDALRAAKRGDAAGVERHLELLADYPLLPYLDYYLLGNRLELAEADAVSAFLANNVDLPVNARLQRDWLLALARRNRWQTFLDQWGPTSDTTLRCHWVNAHIRTDQAENDAVIAVATELWLVGRSQPDACDPVFAWMERASHLTDGLVQQRMELALDARQFSRAVWLARRLDEADRDFVQRWQAMQSNPMRALSATRLPPDTERERRLVTAGLDRLARSNPAQARDRLARISPYYQLNDSQRALILRTAAIIAAQRHQPEAGEWLAEVPGTDPTVVEWRVRAALRAGDWSTTRTVIQSMPAPQGAQSGWRYWLARADAAEGKDQSARQQFTELAQETGYHAWLAADRVGEAYKLRSTPLVADDVLLTELSSRPAFMRAREFLALGMQPEARAEWNGAIANLDEQGLLQAALLAERWQWHAQAIATVNRSGRFDHLEARFPVLFSQQILPHASARGLDPALVYSLIRSESLFVPDARSVAGALGLMQLMPGTGRDVARSLGMGLPNNTALMDPETNIRLGSAYLSTVMARFNQQEVLATAAYNAGPARVQRWLPTEGSLPADIWVETIPFNETRNYVRQVMGGTAVFDWRLGREARSLTERMQDIRVAD